MADQYIFKHNFEPILLPGETANIKTYEGQISVKVEAVGALPEYIKDWGAQTSGTTSTSQTDTNLAFSTMEFAQLRMRVLDPFRLKLYNPSSSKIWMSSKTDFWLPQVPEDDGDLAEFLWQASEFFIWEDDSPNFDLVPLATLVKSRVAFHGWRFRVTQIRERGKIDLWLNSWPVGGRTPAFGNFQ